MVTEVKDSEIDIASLNNRDTRWTVSFITNSSLWM